MLKRVTVLRTPNRTCPLGHYPYSRPHRSPVRRGALCLCLSAVGATNHCGRTSERISSPDTPRDPSVSSSPSSYGPYSSEQPAIASGSTRFNSWSLILMIGSLSETSSSTAHTDRVVLG